MIRCEYFVTVLKQIYKANKYSLTVKIEKTKHLSSVAGNVEGLSTSKIKSNKI